MVKFAMVFSVLIVVIGVYANLVTSASTRGYFLDKAKDELASLEFDKSIEQLQVIKKKKTLWTDMKLTYHDSWFQSV
jgi:ABC-type bacteriocin/lantibiotic exporter with double-glycine peptidase domain